MSRVRWSLVAIVLLSLPLVSCFSDVGDCPTCPPVNSAGIGMFLPFDFDVDSVYVGIDGPLRYRVLRGDFAFINQLAAGTYKVDAVLFHSDEFGQVTTKAVSISVVLERGETRVVVFHHDFPVVVWAPDAVTREEVRQLAAMPSAPHPAG